MLYNDIKCKTILQLNPHPHFAYILHEKKDEFSSCIIYSYDQSWSVMITYDQS